MIVQRQILTQITAFISRSDLSFFKYVICVMLAQTSHSGFYEMLVKPRKNLKTSVAEDVANQT